METPQGIRSVEVCRAGASGGTADISEGASRRSLR